MQAFAALYAELDASTSTLHKVAALQRYLLAAKPDDAAWAVYFLAGGKPRQVVPARLLREAARAAAGLPDWLFEESYQAVGDIAETIAHVLPPPLQHDDQGLARWMIERLLPLRGLDPAQVQQQLAQCWARLDGHARFVMNKLITGGFRVGVSKLLVIRALSQAFSIDPTLLAQRMMGYTDDAVLPDAARFGALIASGPADPSSPEQAGRPYPFFLAQQLQAPVQSLGVREAWLAEWKWDGIRAQMIRRAGQCWLWSRGEELITERFPEIVDGGRALPDGTVIDGEVLAWDAAATRPLPFAALQRRIGRKNLTARVLREAPVVLLAYDLLEHDGRDIRALPQAERRARLQAVAGAAGGLQLSPLVQAADWDELARLRMQSRERGVEGLMLKRRDAHYGVGRTKAAAQGEWWKWKIDPYTIDAVLIYAQRGHGRRASLYTDYTFAVWDGPPGSARMLVPFAKAYSGLTDQEIRQVDAVIRKTTVEKFGPVRSVTPSLVFELGFEGIQRSPRHRSGIAVRFPRMLRLRTDKPVDEADTLADLKSLLPP